VDCLLFLSPWRELFWFALGGLIISLLGLSVALGRQALWPAPRGARAAAAPPAGPDEIELIEGIGPHIAALLRDHGIDTFAGIAALTPGQLRRILLKDPDCSLAEPSTWPFQARLLADGRYGDFNRLATALEGGVPRLENVDGIGEGYARRLRGGALETVADLQRARPSQIAAVFPEGDRARIEAMAPAWIDHARRLHDGDPETLSVFARIGAPASALARANRPAAVAAVATDKGAAPAYWRRESRFGLFVPAFIALALLLLLLLLALFGLVGDGSGQCRPAHSSAGDTIIMVSASQPGAGPSVIVLPWRPDGPQPDNGRIVPVPIPWPWPVPPIIGQCCPSCPARNCPTPPPPPLPPPVPPEPEPCGCAVEAAP
jgi:hypothetical protein